jgi:hypothetical protein
MHRNWRFWVLLNSQTQQTRIRIHLPQYGPAQHTAAAAAPTSIGSLKLNLNMNMEHKQRSKTQNRSVAKRPNSKPLFFWVLFGGQSAVAGLSLIT